MRKGPCFFVGFRSSSQLVRQRTLWHPLRRLHPCCTPGASLRRRLSKFFAAFHTTPPVAPVAPAAPLLHPGRVLAEPPAAPLRRPTAPGCAPAAPPAALLLRLAAPGCTLLHPCTLAAPCCTRLRTCCAGCAHAAPGHPASIRRPGPTWLHPVAPCCTLLHLAAPCCTRLRPCCTRLCPSAPGQH